MQGNATRRILRDGQEITAQQARELLIDSSGKINFPDYEVDLSVGAAKVREFIANGGFIDGDDYLIFKPNTIVYAIPKNSALANQI